MTISIWRYSHLALAVSSFLFILLASVTGIILAFQPISEQIKPYKVEDFNNITLAETIKNAKVNYLEIFTIEKDANDFVLASVITEDGDALNGYINPKTGNYLGDKIEPSSFFQFTTNLHRSLFLKGIGRFFVGLCSFLLFLIAVSGSVLIIKRQRSVKRFFSKIINEDFNQYWHVVLGRLSLIPIIIITVTGVYLSLLRFDMLPKDNVSHNIDYEAFSEIPRQNFQDFAIFKNTKLSEIKSIEFPFSDDIEDYFTLKLKDRELIINQFDGSIISEQTYPLVALFSNLSIVLHTGKGTIVWSIILAIACVNILFFIYSGFAMTLKRNASKLRNKLKKNACKYVILVGSENGGTLPFANALHNQLLKLGETSYITELNKYSKFKNAEHLIIMTSTYGEGEAPTNANKFFERLKSIKQNHQFSFSVVGFGSLAYNDFCKFALDVDAALKEEGMTQSLKVFTINDKSFERFEQWIALFSEKTGLQFTIPSDHLISRPKQTKIFKVIDKTPVHDNPDNTFLITLKPKHNYHFTSGDLLAIYPKNDYHERLYSIGKMNKNLQLSVKYHDNGLGSNYLNNLKINDTFKVHLIENSAFHFPKKASKVIMIANGTGIAPFLGMLSENTKQIETHLYVGLRHQESLTLYETHLQESLKTKKLTQLHIAFSQYGEKNYVQDFLRRDAHFIAKTLENNGVIMICGSLAMHAGVMEVLHSITTSHLSLPLSHFKNNQQIKSDCY